MFRTKKQVHMERLFQRNNIKAQTLRKAGKAPVLTIQTYSKEMGLLKENSKVQCRR